MSSLLTVIYEFDRFRLDRANQRLTRDGLLLATPGRTLSILLDLIEHREEPVPLQKLVDSHFPKSPSGEEELTIEILKLKRLLDDTSKQAPILRFVQGQGYQFDTEVTEYIGDRASDQNFGSKPEDIALPAGRRSSKLGAIGKLLGAAAAVIALVAVVIGIWRFIPQRSTESTSEPTSEAVESSDSTGSVTGAPRVAVLPFQSLTGQANDDSFNRSLTEALFAALSKRSEIRLVSEAAVQRYLEAGASDPVTAGHELGAQMIVRGMAQRLAGHVVVKAQLINTQDGSQIWSTGFDGNSNDLAGLSAKISEKIAMGPAATEHR